VPKGSVRLVVDNAVPAKRRRRKPHEFTPWECRVCETEIGVRTRALVKVRQYAEQREDLKITGGHDVWACAHCLARGKITPVTS